MFLKKECTIASKGDEGSSVRLNCVGYRGGLVTRSQLEVAFISFLSALYRQNKAQVPKHFRSGAIPMDQHVPQVACTAFCFNTRNLSHGGNFWPTSGLHSSQNVIIIAFLLFSLLFLKQQKRVFDIWWAQNFRTTKESTISYSRFK